MGDTKEKVEEKITAFIYCDGGARPNPGPAGYGVHIAVASNSVRPRNVLGKYKLTPKGYVTNVEYKLMDNKDLLGLVSGVEIYGYTENSLTNNTAELDAVIKAIDFLPNIEESLGIRIDDLEFRCDSTYVLGHVKKILEDSIVMRDVVANADRVQILMDNINAIKGSYGVNFEKVKAHTDNLGNNRADLLATMGIKLRFKKNRAMYNMFIGDGNFWKDPVLDTDLYYFKQLFSFYPDSSSTDRSYYGLNYKTETEFGKMMSMVSYTVMKTDEPIGIVLDIINTIRDTLGSLHVPYVVKLRDLLNKDVLSDYLRYGEDFLTIDKRRGLVIKTLTDIEVANVLVKPALSARVMENFTRFDEELVMFLKDEEGPIKRINIDITDMIYEEDAKGKTIIKKDIKNDKYIIQYNYEGTKLKLFMKYDLPPRNTMKRLEKHNPKVTLVLTELGGLIEYKTIITMDDKDAILTTNIYSNKTLKRKKKTK